MLPLLAAACGPRGDPGIELPEGAAAEVRLDAGRVRGTRLGRLRVFLGIPYAAPPIGALRWRPPSPPPPLHGVLDATRAGPVCPQLDRARRGDPTAPADDAPVRGEEDCLRLNVWAHADARIRPVMVFVHGGGFQQGSGTQSSYEGSTLARNGEVVVVTLSYRLGALGLLAHEAFAAADARGSAGDYAIRDQLAALRWVREHIAAFGGDADNVTIFGESAGAVSVCALVASPLGRGLFRRAIAQSPGGCDNWPTLRQGVRGGLSGFARGAEIAAAAGCGDPRDAAACLRAKDAATLVRAGTRGERRNGLPVYSPVIDGVVLVGDAPSRLRAGANDVPLLVGSNADESAAFAGSREVPDEASYERAIREVAGPRAEAVLSVYPPRALGEPRETFLRAFTELSFTCPAETLARAAAQGPEPAYLYHFLHRPPGPVGRIMGAFHGIELSYLFGVFPMGWSPPEDDRRVMHLVQSAWTSFAHAGIPRTVPAWRPYRVEAPAVLALDTRPVLASDVTQGRCARLRAALRQ